MKTYQNEHIFNHPFSTLTRAVWRKYPNPLKPEVLGSDVVERVIEDDGSLSTHRVMKTQFGLPSWSRKLLGSDQYNYGYEKTRLDLNKQFMSQVSRNITFSGTVTMGEKLTYIAHGDDQTKLIQECTVEVHNLPFSGYLEDTVLAVVSGNIMKGRDAMEWVVNRINEEIEEDLESDHTNGFAALQQQDLLPKRERRTSTAQEALETVTDVIEQGGVIARRSVDELSDKALKSVGEITKSVDNISEKAIKSVDNISEIAIKSVDDLSDDIGKLKCRSMENLSTIATTVKAKSVDLGDKVIKSVEKCEKEVECLINEDLNTASIMKSVDEWSLIAKISASNTARYFSDTWSPHALRSYEIFDDFFNLS